MKYIYRIVCSALALGMAVSLVGCKDNNDNLETPDTASVSDSVNAATRDIPTAPSDEFRIGGETFDTSVTEMQLGDVTFTDEDLKNISKCTQLEYFVFCHQT